MLVSLNGVIQHPTDASTTRSYSLLTDNVITFTTAPASGVEIQIRHLGFAGASSGDVSGFYGRTGNVGLTASDHITTGDITSRNINSSGIVTATSFDGPISGGGNLVVGIITATSASFSGDVSIGGTLTYEDVKNVDSVGVGTFRDGIKVGSGVTIEPNGQATFTGIVTFGSSSTTIDGDANTIKVGTALTLGHTQGLQFHTQNLHSAGFEINQINASGIVTASQFKGDGSELTGVSGFSTALSNDTTSLLNQIFKTNVQHNIGAGTSVTIQSEAGSGNVAFTRLDRINVATGATIHVAAGTTFIMNVLNVFS